MSEKKLIIKCNVYIGNEEDRRRKRQRRCRHDFKLVEYCGKCGLMK